MAENTQELEASVAALEIQNNSEERTWRASDDATPALATTSNSKSCTINGTTLNEFVMKCLGLEFDYNSLKIKFGHFCKDFNDEIVIAKPSKALQFSLFIMKKRPLSPKKQVGICKFRFPYEQDEKKIVKTVLVVPPTIEPQYKEMISEETMIITYKQAGLLAMEIFLKVAELAYTTETKIMLSPIGGAIFSCDSVIELSIALRKDVIDVIKIINASCTPGGEYLTHSNMACAIAAIICATKNMSNKNMRESLLNKLVKQYCNADKYAAYDNAEFQIYCEFALGEDIERLGANTFIQSFITEQIHSVSLRSMAMGTAPEEENVAEPTSSPSEEEK